ncbi:hypothetical protein HDU98_001226, partial [Podochytrium sp. JEL0797]
MISDESKAAAMIDKKSNQAAAVAAAFDASPRFNNIVSPLSNLNMIADAAATAEPSALAAEDASVQRRTSAGVRKVAKTDQTGGGGTVQQDPRIASAVHRLEALMQPVPQRKDAGFPAILPNLQPHPQQGPTPAQSLHHQRSFTHLQPQTAQQQPPQQYFLQSQQPKQHPSEYHVNNQYAPPPHQTQQQHPKPHFIRPHSPQPNPPPPTAPLNMTAITTQLHMNPTSIPPPQSYTHPSLGPTVSWTTSILADCHLDPTTDLTDAHRRAFTQCDAMILTAVKERNQFLEISRALVQECGKHREIGGKYLGILKQLVSIVPPNVRVGVKMDLEAIDCFARSEVSIATSSTIPVTRINPAQSQPTPMAPPIPPQTHNHQEKHLSRQPSFEGSTSSQSGSSLISTAKRLASPLSVSSLSDKRRKSEESLTESPELEYL